jgi:hypothetical protein
MRPRQYLPMVVTIVMTALLVMSCLLPGMIPLTPIPTVPAPKMENNTETLIETLNGQDWVYLEALAEEQYTEEDMAQPGTITYTINITDDQSTYFNYGWCATTDEILTQNFEHIRVKLYFNDEELEGDLVHVITFTRPDGLRCGSFGTLLSDWPAGEYQLQTIATFDEKINDGLADYEAGDYVFVYNVTVEK